MMLAGENSFDLAGAVHAVVRRVQLSDQRLECFVSR
jgi:hypothetical protein